MGSRLELQTVLETILGSRNVYYQPPSTIKMQYPAIVYSRDTLKSKFANDNIYTVDKSYELIIIDKDPDSIIIDRVAALPTCKFSRNYISDNLNHDAFTIQF
jgi:hypothetical protein